MLASAKGTLTLSWSSEYITAFEVNKSAWENLVLSPEGRCLHPTHAYREPTMAVPSDITVLRHCKIKERVSSRTC
jgi:hypothetical protein